MVEYKGGRGKKAPYESEVVRVPKPVLDKVNKIIMDFRQGELKENVPNLDIALDIARQILEDRKSAKISLQRFIASLYCIDAKDIKL